MTERPLPIVALLLAGALAAQDSRPAPRPDAVTVTTYREETSRRVFAAIDANADDRLSILEVAKAAPEIGTPEDPTTFRGLDRSKDGYLSWPEFDAHLRRLLARGPFRFAPLRPFEAPESRSARKALSGARALFVQLDRNGDGKLAIPELEAFVRDAGLPPEARAIVIALDRDGSGDVSEEELEPVARLLAPEGAPSDGDDAATSDQETPAILRASDRNRDGVLDAGELRASLVHLDPALARWTQRILADADRSASSSLGAAELALAEKAAAADPLR